MVLIDTDAIRLTIPLLDEVRFVGLCNDLLGEAAVAHGIPRTSVRTNLKTKEPDGGIDAACVDSPVKVPRLVPRSRTDYQFKSGQSGRSAAQIARDDILAKPRVVDGLKNGHAFVYFAAWDRGDRIEEDILEELRKGGLAVDADQVTFLGKEQIVQSMAAAPAVVARYLGVDPDADVIDLATWAGWRTMSNKFEADEAVERRVADLRALIEPPSSTVRVVGSAGDGKTRLVLETLRGSDLSGSVLYIRQASAVKAGVIAHLLRTRDVRCTLVVDEVDDVSADQLQDRLNSRPPGVRLVLIGLDATGRPQPRTLQVEGLSQELLVRVIRDVAPGIQDDTARAIAEDCANSPKLAMLIAERIRDEPQLVRANVLGDRHVQSALDEYLRIPRGDLAWNALAGMAVLMRLGWSGEHEPESVLLFGLLNLDPVRARQAVARLDERYGIAPVAGRFRYISPAILADHLAGRELREWTSDHMAKVFGALTPSMAESFVRRARRLSAILENSAVVEEVILGSQGPFQSLTQVEADKTAFILQHLAAAFPRPTLNALERLIGDASAEALEEATHSRRDLYWALEELLWPASTFETAAGLMLRLAIAENETWANNASNTWVETFQMLLGRTAADWQQRLRVLQAAATHEEPRARTLAAKAVAAAFKSGHLSRSGGPPRDVAGMPEEEWKPRTYKEWADALEAYLGVIDPLVADSSFDVRIAAADCLGEAGANLFRLMKPVAVRWRQSALKLKSAGYEERAALLKPLEWSVARWTDRASDLETQADSEPDKDDKAEEAQGIREALKIINEVERALRPESDFTAQFRRRVTRPYGARRARGSLEEAERAIRADVAELAKAVIREPTLMDGQWEWLLNDKEWRGAERWVEVLGEQDSNRVFAVTLEGLAAKSPRARMWLSLYDLSYAAAAEKPEFVDARLTEFLNRGDYPQVLDLLVRAGYSPLRFATLRGLVGDRHIRVSDLNHFAYGTWGKISEAEADELLTTALEVAEDPSSLVDFLASYLHWSPDAAKRLRNHVLKILQAVPGDDASPVDSYQWSELAKKLIDTDAEKIFDLTLKQASHAETALDAAYVEVLQRAWTSDKRERIFQTVIAPLLEGAYVSSAFWARSILRNIAIENVGEKILLDWVRANPKSRAYALADVIGPPHSPMTTLQASLLEEFAEFGVGGAFSSRFNSGVFTGSILAWTKSKLSQAQTWASDPRPAVRDWGLAQVESLKRQVERAQTREAEERLIGGD